MKKYVQIAAAFLVAYAFGAFVTMKLNPADWESVATVKLEIPNNG